LGWGENGQLELGRSARDAGGGLAPDETYRGRQRSISIKYATKAKLDLLTIDGSGGGTGMSPWNMMESGGVPSLLLHAKAYEYAKIMADKGADVVDLRIPFITDENDDVAKEILGS
jgi:glutamate synthase domain-containing protein 2